jgi:branched-chain amino acid transport system permease protein
VPFWFAVPVAAAVAGLVAAIIGIPALRIKGLFLGIVTLAFGLAVDAALFNDRYFGWILPKNGVDRPTLFFLNFDKERPMYYLSLACLVLAVVIARNLRRSRFGRLLIAMRENEANVQSFGVSAVRLKLTAFAVSGSMAGFAGAVFAHQQRGVSGVSFSTTLSTNTFVFTVLGGIGSVAGALTGALFQTLTDYFLPSNDFFATVLNSLRYGGLTLIVMFVVPAGLWALLVVVRDAWLRIVAQRRQIIVPSLFADYDPAALERRLIPLGDVDSHSGLAALGPGAKFRLGSELHGGGADGDTKALRGRQQERLAIGAAAEALGDVGADVPTDVVGAAMLAMTGEDLS